MSDMMPGKSGEMYSGGRETSVDAIRVGVGDQRVAGAWERMDTEISLSKRGVVLRFLQLVV